MTRGDSSNLDIQKSKIAKVLRDFTPTMGNLYYPYFNPYLTILEFYFWKRFDENITLINSVKEKVKLETKYTDVML